MRKALWKRIADGVDVVLEVITDLSFLVIFCTFMLAIVSRYFFKRPVTWSYEISVLGYIWTMFFGVGLAMKRDEHVVFGLVFDVLQPKCKFAFYLFYNILLLFLLFVSTIPCLRALMTRTMVTGVLKMPYKVVFCPFMLMYVDMMYRTVINILKATHTYLEAA